MCDSFPPRPEDLDLRAAVDLPLDFASQGAAAFQAAVSYCRAEFGRRCTWAAYPARGVATFGFALERDAVQFLLWYTGPTQPASAGWALGR